MAVIFDARERHSREPLRPGGGLFHFYDTCGRLGYDQFRCIMNGWLQELPEPDGLMLAAQMQGGDNSQFEAGTVELIVHALLKRKGYQVECHPELPHTRKKPDFAVKDWEGQLLAYVEVTTNNPPRAEIARANNEAKIHRAIDSAPLPSGCRLGYRVEKYGRKSPPMPVARLQPKRKSNEDNLHPVRLAAM